MDEEDQGQLELVIGFGLVNGTGGLDHFLAQLEQVVGMPKNQVGMLGGVRSRERRRGVWM